VIYLYRTYSSVLRVWSLLFDKQAKREREDKSMNRIKELLKDKKVVAGVVAAVVVLFAVGGTTVYLANSKDGDKTTAAETQNAQVTTSAKTTEKTTAAMEIAQAQTGAGETIATETAVEVGNVENEAGVSEETEAEQKSETVELAQPEETPHREEAVSENTGNDAEEEKEPEVAEDTASEPEEAPASEPTPEPAPAPETEVAPTLTDEERLVATGKWEKTSESSRRGHTYKHYTYTDSITGYTIDAVLVDGTLQHVDSDKSEAVGAIMDAHGTSHTVSIDTLLAF
jgi:hypothetical protein